MRTRSIAPPATWGVAVAGLLALVSIAGPANAAGQPRMSARAGETSRQSFPPLLGVAPTSGTVDLDPETCGRPEVTFCDTVPIDVATSGDVSVEVVWADLDGGVDDIDILLFDAGSGGEYSKLDSSETSSRPEQVAVRVGAGRLNLVVVHYAGANNGYEVATAVATSDGPAPVANIPGSPTPPAATPKVITPAKAGVTNATTRSPRAISAGAPTTPASEPAQPAMDPAGGDGATAAAPVDDPGRDLGGWAWLAAVGMPAAIALIMWRARGRSSGLVG